MTEGQRLARREDFFSYYCLFRNVKKIEQQAFFSTMVILIHVPGIQGRVRGSRGELILMQLRLEFWFGCVGWFVVQSSSRKKTMRALNTWTVINLEGDKRQKKRRALGRKR